MKAAMKDAPRANRALAAAVAVLGIVVIEILGLRVIGGTLASTVAGQVGRGFFLAIGFSVVWFACGGAVLGRLMHDRPALRRVSRATWLGTAVIAAAFFAWTSFRETTVHENVATGVPASAVLTTQPTSSAGGSPGAQPVDVQLVSGSFRPLDENASGNAAIVQLAKGGRVLTLTNFSSSNGPDVRVYLVAGRVQRGADVHDKVDLGGLKGNRGDQQYSIPDYVDVGHYATAVIYCRSFQVAFGAAELGPS
jgi:hypothetical protein